MTTTYTVDSVLTDAAFGALIGASPKTVHALRKRQRLPTPLVLGPALQALYHRLSEQAAGRMGSDTEGPLILEQERAALAREQRVGHELKNAILRGTYAETAVLERVLAAAAQAVVERFDHLPARLRTACPELPQAALDQVMTTVAEARNEWATSTDTLFPTEDQADDQLSD